MRDAKHLFISAIYCIYCFFQNYALAATTAMAVARTRPNIDVEPFILGLIGAFCVCAWLQKIDNSLKTYTALCISMLLAGLGSLTLSNFMVKCCLPVEVDSLFYLTPLLIGIGIPICVPIGIEFLSSRYGSKQNAN